MMIRLLAAMSIFCAALTVHAQLVFETKEQVIDAKPNQTGFDTEFKFTNTGTEKITVQRVKSSCGCTTPKLKKRTYEAGESGIIKATMRFGAARGRYVKKIYVYAKTESQDKAEITTLSIGAVIPQFAAVTPRYIKWGKGEEAKAKEISVKVTYDKPIHLINVQSSNPAWKPIFTEVTKGKEYTITLTPPNTDTPSRTALSIEMDYPADQHLVLRATARVSHSEIKAPEKQSSGWLKKMFE